VTTITTGVTTTSGIEAVVTFVLAGGIATATADAVPSEPTRSYDEACLRAENLYLESVAARGLSEAGEPPLSGAETYLAEIEVRPVGLKGEPGTSRGVQYAGGSCIQWRVVWTRPSVPTPAQFKLSTPLATTTIQLP
jgi:hypothetical protein